MHRRESILQAIGAALTGLTTTGSNVTRARAYRISSSGLPHLTIEQGLDQRRDDGEQGDDIDRDLAVIVTARVRDIGNLETDLNQISAEVYAALTADRSQGLAYVYDTNIDSETAPEIEAGETEQPVAMMSMTYVITYSHSTISAEA